MGNWWESSELAAETEKMAQNAQRRRETEMAQAKRDRDMAILGDIARLGAQVGASVAGARNMNNEPAFTAKANDRMRALREKHAAEVERYAQELRRAREEQRKDNNARMRAEREEAFRQQQAQDQREYRDKSLAIQEMKAKDAAGKQTVQEQKVQDYYDYQEMIADNPQFAVTKPIPAKDEDGYLVKNKDGSQKYEEVIEPNPNPNQVANALAKGRAAGYVKGKKMQEVKQRKANPMGNNKKVNPMN